MASPAISQSPYPIQQPLHPQNRYATSNQLQLTQPATPAEWQINKIEVMAVPAISPSPLPNQPTQHPQQGYTEQPEQLAIPGDKQITKNNRKTFILQDYGKI